MNETIPSQDLKTARLRRAQARRWTKLQADPTCSKCGETKTINDFYPMRVDYWCKVCSSADRIARYHKIRREMTPEQQRAEQDRINAYQKNRRDEMLAAMTPEELAAHKERINRGNTERRHKVRHEVYMAYGGYVCNCCGETEKAFLSIDHVNNDGAEHKRKHRLQTGEQVYRWLKRHNFPPGYQVLCMNCQWGKRNNDGICPHQVRCNDYPERE